MRWGYGLHHVDRYVGENNEEVNVVYGLRKHGDETMFAIRVVLTQQSKSTSVEIYLQHVALGGWPMVTDEGQDRFTVNAETYYDNLLKPVAKDLISYCEKPHGQGSGVMEAIRNLFGTGGEKRKYKLANYAAKSSRGRVRIPPKRVRRCQMREIKSGSGVSGSILIVSERYRRARKWALRSRTLKSGSCSR